MDFDFALLLVVLTAVTGVVWLFDWLLLARRRAHRADTIKAMTALTEEEREARARTALQESVPVEYARSFFPVLLVILLFRSFIAEPFKIPSGSMMPTLLVGDFILVNKFAYGLRLPVLNTKILDVGEPKRGDVFVFRYPQNPKEDYIKRVIGLPGDEITYRNKILYVNGKAVEETGLGAYTGPAEPGHRMDGAQVKRENLDGIEHRILELPQAWGAKEGSWTVPSGHFFAMGDNRDNSADSRFWGFVPEENLVGKAFVIWMNWDGGIDFSRIGTIIH
ncbi:signal peptidase I [Dokdonella sp.]|uniref:signal peptidase I n=1 Tax=Dokdonella sp. TaxID=2291710 RepID=UPI002F40B3EE